jgi:hypothetical protein
MTAHVDYTRLFAPLPHLTLEESLGGYFTAIDQTGRIFYPPTADMNKVVGFMRALALRGDATLDEGSIMWFRALRQFGEFSVKVEGEPNGGAESSARLPVSLAAASTAEPASPSPNVAGGRGTDGEPLPGATGDAAAPAPSPPRLHLVRGDAA